MAIPTDPRLSTSLPESDQQWHLNQRDAGQYDLRVMAAWADYTGAGINVFVIDDGFDYTNSDLAGNYDQTLDFDFDTNTADAFGTTSDAHGTAVMGIIGADDNGSGTVGIAFDARLVGYRLYGLISDTWLIDVRDSIRSAADSGAHVVNLSQGMANWLATIFGGELDQSLVRSIRTSIDYAVDTGRDDRGTIIVKSAGNSRDTLYDVNADMWTNDTRQVVVAAVDQSGAVSWYSSYGAANLVSGFGTPGEVVTTDRTGSAGYDATDITNQFNGTSSAAPMVSGVVALMLDANDNLGWRDVQEILAASARHVGSAMGSAAAGYEREAWKWNGATTWNGGGMHFSIDYGYGLVDATAAVRLAETWLYGGTAAQTSANERSTYQDGLNSSTQIPDGDSAGKTFTIRETDRIEVERVTLTVTFATTYVGDVSIYLTSPDGTRSTLVNRSGTNQDFNGTWTFESQAFRGVSSAGDWKVKIVDSSSGDILTVSDLKLRTYGSASSTNDRYVFTNEYSDYDGVGGHSRTITDTNGGTDTINAAAVTSASLIDLNSGSQSKIDGVTVIFRGMDRGIGGDGGDRLYGNSGSNSLYGMRGNDTLNGRGGNDSLNGHRGNDNLYGGSGNDKLSGGSGNDSFYFNTKLNSSTNVDTISDFSVVDDRIVLENSIFTKLTKTGTLFSSAFVANTSGFATDSKDRIIYETDTGKLYYDSNGNASGGRVLFAKLDDGLHLTHSDFLVV
ncbi:S8 family serine peptidase [Ciceribacter sp. L1K23]|uniref:S8 family serine peptidase n=1 Tax=Ciceribacter sp. L1K23 TaxID=2820276 RepID=UPI001B818A29|nr:S8 family serine peptidase [Ciceribacter sp. L1K23]MBR0555865.1 S8 family serine peptidase [Ciceribacter sp. L1K23]